MMILIYLLAVFAVFCLAILVILRRRELYELWLSGYDDYNPYAPKPEPEPKRPLKERIRLWWLRGYDDYESLPAYQALMRKEAVETQSEIVTVTVEGNLNEKARVETVESAKHIDSGTVESGLLPSATRTVTSRSPSKEDLARLKEALKIEKGCLQYKEHGDKVYISKYDREGKGKKWTMLGAWSDLHKLIGKGSISGNTP